MERNIKVMRFKFEIVKFKKRFLNRFPTVNPVDLFMVGGFARSCNKMKITDVIEINVIPFQTFSDRFLIIMANITGVTSCA